MEKQIQEAFNEDIIKQAFVHYNHDENSIKRLGGFENFIYEYTYQNKPYVIRFVHSSHRSFEHVLAEIEFIDYLSNNGANVSTVIHTVTDKISEKITTKKQEYFTITAFTKAPGTYVGQKDITEEFLEYYGECVGQLHALTKDYKPEHKRYHWYEEDYKEIGKRNLPDSLQYIVDLAIDHEQKLKQYETSIDSYGLIHTDLHFGNMYYDQTTLTFFDFDDSCYKYFISDIAIILFYHIGISKLNKVEMEDKMIWFLTHFMKGYEKKNKLDISWFHHLNDFFYLRMVILIMVIYAAGEDVLSSNFGTLFIEKFLPLIKSQEPMVNVERIVKEVWNI